jgi:hypothetical protein
LGVNSLQSYWQWFADYAVIAAISIAVLAGLAAVLVRSTRKQKREFFDEDDLKTFEGWLRYQAIDAAALPPEQLEMWRTLYEEVRAASLATPRMGRIKFKPNPNEYRYAVAIRKGVDLWLTLWVKRDPKGDFYVFAPRPDGRWNPHVSYHRNGRFHSKSYNRPGIIKQLQPLTGKFKGTEHLGIHGGHGTSVGAICDPADFNGVVEVPIGVLGPKDGMVLVDLVEPGYKPLPHPGKIVQEKVFNDFVPHVVIRIASS